MSCYAIIRHNIRTYRSAGVVEVIRSKEVADSTLQELEADRDSLDHYEGWRYFIERTRLKAGIDPAEATRHRQAELEAREWKALQKTEASIFPLARRP